MRISDDGINLIKYFEGLELEAYYDAVGVLTIGYGHTGDDVFEGQVITEAEAEALLRRDLDRFEAAVNSGLRVETAQTMFDAFVSLAYNVGSSAFLGSTALRRHNKKQYTEAAEAITWWNKAGGQVLNGLVRRRAAEEAHYLSGIDEVVESVDHAGGGIEENSPRRNNPVTTRSTAGAATSGAAGAGAAGAVLMDDDDEADTSDATSTDTQDTSTDSNSTDPTDTDDTETSSTDAADPDNVSDDPSQDEDASDDDTSDETEVTDQDESDDAETPASDGEVSDETTETTEGTEDDGGAFMEKFTQEDKTDAIVILLGAVAILGALWVILARIDDWLKYRR